MTTDHNKVVEETIVEGAMGGIVDEIVTEVAEAGGVDEFLHTGIPQETEE